MQNKDFFSGVPEEVGEFLLHLLNKSAKRTLSESHSLITTSFVPIFHFLPV